MKMLPLRFPMQGILICETLLLKPNFLLTVMLVEQKERKSIKFHASGTLEI